MTEYRVPHIITLAKLCVGRACQGGACLNAQYYIPCRRDNLMPYVVPPPPPPLGIGIMPPPSALAGLPTASALPNPASSEAGVNPPGVAQLQPGTTRLPAGSMAQILSPNGEITNPNVGVPPGLPVTSVSATLANLLPLANSELGHSAGGVYVGGGRSPVPYKLAQKIRRWEFVDMGELLPEFWCSYRDDKGTVKRPSSSRRTRKVTEIFTWVQCFNTYVSVLAPAHPETIPEPMADMSTIVRTSQDFSGLAWVRYNAGFRRQAALTGNKLWSQINATLYTLCFAGNALATTRCELCFASSHSTAECEQRGEADPEMPTRMKAIETVVRLVRREKPVDCGTGIAVLSTLQAPAHL